MSGLDVLDVVSGGRYSSLLLSHVTKALVGVDIVVGNAVQKYVQDNLKFLYANRFGFLGRNYI